MTILTTGATGTVGRHLARRLAERGATVRALVRDRDRAADLLGPDVDLAVGDLADRAPLTAALDGVSAVYLACANHPLQVAWETGLIDAAVAAGVRRIVKLSAIDAAIGSPVAFADAHGRIEEHLSGERRRPRPAQARLPDDEPPRRRRQPAPGGRALPPGRRGEDRDDRPAGRRRGSSCRAHQRGPVPRELELTGPAAVTFDDVAEQLTHRHRTTGRLRAGARRGGGGPAGRSGCSEWFATNLVDPVRPAPPGHAGRGPRHRAHRPPGGRPARSSRRCSLRLT